MVHMVNDYMKLITPLESYKKKTKTFIDMRISAAKNTNRDTNYNNFLSWIAHV